VEVFLLLILPAIPSSPKIKENRQERGGLTAEPEKREKGYM
jgi:hypothetical protein